MWTQWDKHISERDTCVLMRVGRHPHFTVAQGMRAESVLFKCQRSVTVPCCEMFPTDCRVTELCLLKAVRGPQIETHGQLDAVAGSRKRLHPVTNTCKVLYFSWVINKWELSFARTPRLNVLYFHDWLWSHFKRIRSLKRYDIKKKD